MPRCRGRPTESMSELHSTEEGMCLLPCGSTKCYGEQITTVSPVRCRLGTIVCCLIFTTAQRIGKTIRAITSPISLSNGTVQCWRSIPAHASGSRKLFAGAKYVYSTRLRNANISDMDTGGFPAPHQGLRGPSDPRMAWNAAEPYGQDQMPVLTSAPQDFWRYNNVRAPVDFAPFPSGSPHAGHHPQYEPNSPFTEHRDSHQWPPPQQPLRSMSYGHVEHNVRNNDAVFPFQQEFRPHPNHPPSSLNIHSPMMTQPTGPQSAPVGGPYGQAGPYSFSQDPQAASTLR